MDFTSPVFWQKFTTILTTVVFFALSLIAAGVSIWRKVKQTDLLKRILATDDEPEKPKAAPHVQPQRLEAPRADLRALVVETYQELLECKQGMIGCQEHRDTLEQKVRTWERIHLEREEEHAREIESLLTENARLRARVAELEDTDDLDKPPRKRRPSKRGKIE